MSRENDPLRYVVSLNLHLRHLTINQRAACAVEFLDRYKEEAKKWQGARTDISEKIRTSNNGRTIKKVAEDFHTNARYVEDCAKLKEIP